MKIIRTIAEMRKKVNQLKDKEQSTGFVPTMGYFHDGHLELMKSALSTNDYVIVSIFVNPLQFGPNEDYEQYPRDEEHDMKLAEALGVHALFIPTVQDMYPTRPAITMTVTERTNILCGANRPGHFDGVVTVLTKLFNIIQPERAYFGKKDAQQLAVVDKLVNDFNFPLQLVGVSTVREKDGLAKSSRNIFLNNEERTEAVWISKALQFGKQLVVDGEKNTDIIVKEVSKVLETHISGKIEYIELLNYPELNYTKTIEGTVIVAMAIQFERARLIDNLIINQSGDESSRILLQESNPALRS